MQTVRAESTAHCHLSNPCQRLPEVTRIVLLQAGHLSWIEAPIQVSTILRGFLTRLHGTRQR